MKDGPTIRQGDNKSNTILVVMVLIAVGAVTAALFSGFELDDITDFFGGGKSLSYEEATAKLSDRMEGVTWREDVVEGAEAIAIQSTTLEDTLPNIATFAIPVRGGGGVTAEIFVSSEKSGGGTDGWMVEAAEAFNASNKRIAGQPARISIRKIASGTGYQFIASGKYRPDGFSPSNHLWVRMAEGRGVTMTPIRERTVGNIAGIVMKTSVAEQYRQEDGSVAVSDLIDAVVQGKVVTGYTNPYASSTGLNFLVTVLATFAGGDESKLLSPEVVSAFEKFQRGIPFVALTTLQMRDSVQQDGSLDAFVMEYQTFVKTAELKSGYDFIPFGIPHDNPLYAVGNPSAEKRKVLEMFANFLESDKLKRLAADYGFNPDLNHKAAYDMPDGGTLIQAQRVWKQKKDASRPISAVFVSDVSGSMDGSRLQQLKQALLDGASFISEDNAIGLVEFNNEVRVVLPIKPLKLLHRSAFHAAVKQMYAGGGTAMYDAVAVALTMLAEEKTKNPNAKLMLFVLTDGETNEGMAFEKINRIIKGMQVPIYTVGFEADLSELGRLAALVEAASLNADEENLRYKIGSLLNSQM